MSAPAERKEGENTEPQAGGGGQNRFALVGGLVGSIFATLCCIGIAPLVGLVMAAGLGFILTLTILLPMLLVFLGIGGYALWRSYRRHGVYFPILLHALSGIVVVALISGFLHGLLIWVGLLGILSAAIWNIRLEYLYWHRVPEVNFSGSAKPPRSA